ncbi:MAG: chemotaxis protein CheW [Magnetococcales bacterium]|nr:chemotaxis protein CheW [Magnetococcales bacterium]MBF0155024.1 chemotaxis protein CheW [Magnetococcales bacterium]
MHASRTRGEELACTQYLTFTLDNEIFAVDIAKVREVLEYTAITHVPRTPEFMRGIINLRGKVVPVVDMRMKFSMAESERTVNTCIIIVEIVQDETVRQIGALADSVKEVMDIDHDKIEPAPKIGTNLRSEFLKGMGKHDNQFIMILDINRVFSNEDLMSMQQAVH